MKKISIINQHGFTFIEIIAVLVILGIAATVALSKYTSLQEDARAKAAQSAVFETKARLFCAYGKYFLKNSIEPSHIKDICGSKGLNDKTILPVTGSGNVPMGKDFTVTLKSGTNDVTITVSQVQGVKLSPAVTDKWSKP